MTGLASGKLDIKGSINEPIIIGKVAMKNATDEFKNMANYITEYTNDEDGVAKFIEKNTKCIVL